MVYVPRGDRPIGRDEDPKDVHSTDLVEIEDFETCDSCQGEGCQECEGEGYFDFSEPDGTN
ncbi:hypothetical protein QUB56_31765 [Microcoleus sp. AR_TQ3_B6]|uniref:hypothetical protein n=1 Tax=Microcoleus sp. AR_TQ3_B6 TaxID=3055284 RepID=UPI002FD0CA87